MRLTKTVAALLAAGALASPLAASAANCTAKANVSPDNQSVNEGVQVTLNASPSSPNGQGEPIAYLWQQTAGPAVTLSANNVVKPTFTAPQVTAAGATITFKLTVTGCSPAQQSVVSTNITVNNVAGNTAPFASATVSPPSASEGQLVTLSAAGSADPENDPLTFLWQQTSGPAVVLSNATAVSPTFIAPNTAYPAGASLGFKVTVSDGNLSAVATVTSNIVWVDDPPVAALSCPAAVNEGQSVTLDGSSSSDSDDGIKTYAWAQVLGPPYISVSGFTTPSITFNAPALGLGQDGFVPFRLTVTDFAGQSSQKECTVQIKDVTPPVLSGASNQSVEATSAAGAAAFFNVTASDAVDGGPLSVTCSKNSGDNFAFGTTTVNCSANDSAGNTGTASFTVTVADTTGPVIAAHDDVVEEATSAAGAVSNYTLPGTSDAVDGAGTASCSPAPGTQFALGTTPVTCTASDTHGNAATPTGFKVKVQDTVAPVITAPGDVTTEATGALTHVAHDDATATDAVGPVTISSDAPAGDLFPVGETTIHWLAKDGAGNTAGTTSLVTVTDHTPPTVTDNDDLVLEATSAAGAPATFGTPTASDLVDGSLPVTCDAASGDTFPIGLSTVTCSATDAHGNTGSSSFTVTVQDTTPPVVTVPANMTLEATGPSGAVATFSASATDIVDGAVTTTCVPASGSTFVIGTATVTCSATDAHGNTGSNSFSVTVQDTTAPVLTLPGNITKEATGPSGASATWVASASDLVDGSVTPVCVPASGSTFGITTTMVNCSATDAHGNTSNGSFTVTVQDTTKPVIAAHADVYANATSSAGAIVTYTSPTASDLVDGNVAVTCLPASGSQFALGSTTINCSATDSHGNTATSSFKVIVSYNFSGFFKPVDNLPVINVVKAGQAIPVKFSLGGNMGLNIFAAGYPASGPIACTTGPVDAVEETVTAGGSTLSYDATTGQYNYVWKTDKAWAASCRQLVVKLADGTSAKVANFNFTR